MSSSLITRSLINADWSIFILHTALSLVTCHLIIVSNSPRSFMLYFMTSNLFIISTVVIVFDSKKKLLTYTLIMLILLSNHWMRMLRSPLCYLKLVLLLKAITFWFQSFPDYLSLYKLLNNQYSSFS